MANPSGIPRTEEQWRAWLGQWLAELLGRPVAAAEFERPLRDFGVSSRSATVLAARIGEVTGEERPSTLVWTAPTIADLARTIAGGTRRAPDAEAPVGEPGVPVAVVGLACRFPGAPTAERFWSLMTGGETAISEVPAGRWAQFAPGADDHGLPRAGGHLADVSAFDAEFFGISPREAEGMDPQQRLLLEVAWEALGNAGIPAKALRGTDTGVFVGLSATEYAQLTMTDLDRVDAWSGTGAAASLAANRLSYALGAHGPSMTVDTACSSSLVAVHLAVRALRAGEASAALVGGVNLLLSPGITANFHLAGALAADGRCKPFDASADGIVRGEGCGVVVLKRLPDALADGDRVLAVLRGSAVNSDGRSNGITAPNPVAQERLLARAYREAGVSPRTVDYVEAHGTGTPLDGMPQVPLAHLWHDGEPIDLTPAADLSLTASINERRQAGPGSSAGSRPRKAPPCPSSGARSTVRTRTLLTALAVVAGALGAPGQAAAAPAGVATGPQMIFAPQSCPFPLLVEQPVRVEGLVDLPTTAPLDQPTPATQATFTVTFPAAVRQGLFLVGAETLDGTITVPLTGTHSDGRVISTDHEIPLAGVPVPGPPGPIQIVGGVPIPSVTETAPTVLTWRVGGLRAFLTPKRADGTPTGLGSFNTGCAVPERARTGAARTSFGGTTQPAGAVTAQECPMPLIGNQTTGVRATTQLPARLPTGASTPATDLDLAVTFPPLFTSGLALVDATQVRGTLRLPVTVVADGVVRSRTEYRFALPNTPVPAEGSALTLGGRPGWHRKPAPLRASWSGRSAT
ncbi:Malonyl CoA-acyl carrier protein transacylase [Actinokineospora spheciospongiae]|uniref:Malonyl CoA-acyl carrier protein transacylase n=1 Tax=Actinokineospora spheciospongiae TaxID=909613 RepID=W7IWF6_9PSEU|nr:type I polyketide synthase [Actinokineospora spheciospongiae]EWC60796.1 Malonyl CoA-acyl carrier protein transacylase [Actinokineospora spheciospongiae]